MARSMRIVYHWLNGAYVNSLYDDFDNAYKELCVAFGPPVIARVLYEQD
jgi:hypothetical protein